MESNKRASLFQEALLNCRHRIPAQTGNVEGWESGIRYNVNNGIINVKCQRQYLITNFSDEVIITIGYIYISCRIDGYRIRVRELGDANRPIGSAL